jgi:hypothetical protein
MGSSLGRFLPHLHARLRAIRELDTRCLECVAYVVESTLVVLALSQLNQRDRRLSDLLCGSQFVLRPTEQLSRSAALSRRHTPESFLNLTPGRSPFVNSTPARSREVWIASIVRSKTPLPDASNRTIVAGDTSAISANSRTPNLSAARRRGHELARLG